MKTLRRLGLAALASASLSALAHDTWFEPLPAKGDAVTLALGTGTTYPLQETGVGAEYLADHGCAGVQGEPLALQPLRNAPAALLVQAPRRAATCWAQLTPFEIELPPDKIAIYFKDINPSPDVRAAWAGMQRRGLPWRERYTKHARIELGAAGTPASTMDMDARIESGEGPLRAGGPLVVQVLRDGRPLAGQAVELRSESIPLGVWRRTDAEGRARYTLPLPGRWVLRGTDLRLSASDPDRWESRFFTLVFDVPGAAAQQVSRAP